MPIAQVRSSSESWAPVLKGLTLLALVSILRFGLLVFAGCVGLLLGAGAVIAVFGVVLAGK